jgi:hypothetical protein
MLKVAFFKVLRLRHDSPNFIDVAAPVIMTDDKYPEWVFGLHKKVRSFLEILEIV